jgi:hypothetical protein
MAGSSPAMTAESVVVSHKPPGWANGAFLPASEENVEVAQTPAIYFSIPKILAALR